MTGRSGGGDFSGVLVLMVIVVTGVLVVMVIGVIDALMLVVHHHGYHWG